MLNRKSKINLLSGLLLFFISGLSQAQIRTNLELFQSLIDSSLLQIKNNAGSANFDSIACVLPPDAQVLKSYTLLAGRKVFNNNNFISGSGQHKLIQFNIEDLHIRYPETGWYSFMGDYYLVRNAVVKGNYYYEDKNTDSLHHFNLSYTDTIPMLNRENVELQSLRFTTASIPPEPFFQSLWEPVIGITAIAISVYLLFTVRNSN